MIDRGHIRIEAERKRQVEVEGFGPARDDSYGNGQLVEAAWAFALKAKHEHTLAAAAWPTGWDLRWLFKTDISIRNYEKCGAMLLAERDRLLRLPANVLTAFSTTDPFTGRRLTVDIALRAESIKKLDEAVVACARTINLELGVQDATTRN